MDDCIEHTFLFTFKINVSIYMFYLNRVIVRNSVFLQ